MGGTRRGGGPGVIWRKVRRGSQLHVPLFSSRLSPVRAAQLLGPPPGLQGKASPDDGWARFSRPTEPSPVARSLRADPVIVLRLCRRATPPSDTHHLPPGGRPARAGYALRVSLFLCSCTWDIVASGGGRAAAPHPPPSACLVAFSPLLTPPASGLAGHQRSPRVATPAQAPHPALAPSSGGDQRCEERRPRDWASGPFGCTPVRRPSVPPV